MNRRWQVAAIGDSFTDHVFSGFTRWPQQGEEAFAENYSREAGGGAVNTACALAKLGRNAALVSVVGRKDGDWVLERVREFGVDTSAVRRSDRATGITAAISSPADRTFFTYRGASGEIPVLLRDSRFVNELAHARHVHFAFQPERDAAIPAFEKLRAAECTISLDLGWHEQWLRDPDNIDVIRLASVFLPNQLEAQTITGQRDPRAMLEAFARCGVRTVAIKLGEQGAVMLKAGKIYSSSSYDVQAVDTTGAGDAFDAGFIHAMLDQEPPERCLAIACLCGALSTRGFGALSALPSRAELENRL